MSKLGKKLIDSIESVKSTGLVVLEASPDVVEIRKKLNLSQKQFAEVYHINPETIKKWEQNKRNPDTISRAYLKCIDKNPEIIKKLVNS